MADSKKFTFSIDATYPHKGLQFQAQLIPPECWDDIQNFQARSDDIYVSSVPRSGTHWMMRIVGLIMGNDDTNFLTTPLFEQVFIAALTDPSLPRRMGYQMIEEQPTDRRRVLFTHLPATHQPKSFWTTEGVKIICIMRNPFDVYKSLHKLSWNLLPDTLKDFSAYLKYNLEYGVGGTWCDHVKSFWERRLNKKLLIVCYEDLKENFRPTVSNIANFLERPLSAKELDTVYEGSTLEVMRALQEKRKMPGIGVGKIIDKGLSNEAIKEYSDEDVAFVKSVIKDKLAGTDIRYLKEIL